MNPQLLHQFLVVTTCLFVLGLIVMVLVWEFGHRAGRNEEKAEQVEQRRDVEKKVAVLEADNKRLTHLLEMRPVRYVEAPAPQKLLGPGVEYSESRRWKTAPSPEGSH